MPTTPKEQIVRKFVISTEDKHITDVDSLKPQFLLNGNRLDQVLATAIPDKSREQLKKIILQGRVLFNQQVCNRPNTKVSIGDEIQIELYTEKRISALPQNIAIDVIYEDEHLLILNKQKGMVVHPGAGNENNTLMNALLFHYHQAVNLPRAGIVHRLDKDTTGLLLVGKTESCVYQLQNKLKEHAIKREYQAVVTGSPISGGKINQPIGRHPKDRTKMAINHIHGKPAITDYYIERRLGDYSLLRVILQTGRTHQIRVHFSSINLPVVGDKVYGGRKQLGKKLNSDAKNTVLNFKRQALHAYRLSFVHPITARKMQYRVQMPNDMQNLIDTISNCYPEDEQVGNFYV